MKNLDDKARIWLERHAHEIGPEDLPFEEELAEVEFGRKLIKGRWPNVSIVPNMGVFGKIRDEESFNRIVGDPGTWKCILERQDLYCQWIKPQAVLIFGKKWFDRVKWKNSIQRMTPFPLFSESERTKSRSSGIPLEDTGSGRSKILRIISRVEHALEMYLMGGGWTHSGRVKRPGGYIVDSIKNEFIREIGSDMGYRLVQVPICPLCTISSYMNSRRSRKRRIIVPLQQIEPGMYSCGRCLDTHKNLKLCINSKTTDPIDRAWAIEHAARTAIFTHFEGATCVCPSPKCTGKFVPLRAVNDSEWWSSREGLEADKAIKNLRVCKGVQRFRNPPKALLGIPLSCPYCGERFTPQDGLRSASGFKKQSGKLTGIPLSAIWRQKEEYSLDRRPSDTLDDHFRIVNMRESIVDEVVDPLENMAHRQRVEILIEEIIIELSRHSSSTAPAVVSRCFNMAAIEWMLRHPIDASHYFFGDKRNGVSEAVRGKEVPIHQVIFHFWMRRLASAIPEIRKIDGSRIRTLADLKWLCRPPKYNGGPKSIFTSKVGVGMRIVENSSLIARKNGISKPRIAWILSVKKDGKGKNLAKHISACEWHSFRISKESELMESDRVKVEALMMPGHHCHAPIKRIARLRTDLLASIVERVRLEESTGHTDTMFWQDRKIRVEYAKRILRHEIEEFL